jgi:hypothetical protein
MYAVAIAESAPIPSPMKRAGAEEHLRHSRPPPTVIAPMA